MQQLLVVILTQVNGVVCGSLFMLLLSDRLIGSKQLSWWCLLLPLVVYAVIQAALGAVYWYRNAAASERS